MKKLLRHHGEIHNPFNEALFLVGNMALGGSSKTSVLGFQPLVCKYTSVYFTRAPDQAFKTRWLSLPSN